MNENGYKIMHIEDGIDSKYGNIHIIMANPVQNNGFGMYHSMTIGNDTETFFIPANQRLLNQIIIIARGGGLWYPDEDDFVEEKILNENTNSHIMIHRHVSFFKNEYDEDLNSGHDACLIPNMGNKIQTLNQQFYQGNWFESYYSFRNYVESLAEGDDVQNFWGWLFDRTDFNGCMPWNLPLNYEQEYNRFLDACENTDNTEY